MSNRDKADMISYRAYPMYSHSAKDGSFPMYANNTPASYFWRGFAEKCLDKGLSEKQTKMLMRSSLMRHGLDNYEDGIEKLGAEFLTESMVEWAENES